MSKKILDNILKELNKFQDMGNISIHFIDERQARDDKKRHLYLEQYTGIVYINIYENDSLDTITENLAKANHLIDESFQFRRYYLNNPNPFEYLKRNLKSNK